MNFNILEILELYIIQNLKRTRVEKINIFWPTPASRLPSSFPWK